MPPVGMAMNTTPHRLPPLFYPKSVSPSRDSSGHHETAGRGLQETRGIPEGSIPKDPRQDKAARKRELARRHLSNSLQGLKTILPDLRRTQSFSVPAPNGAARDQGKVATLRRDTSSLGTRKPLHDVHEVRAAVRRSRSLRAEKDSSMESPPLLLSQSLPQAGNLSLAALVHELNASMHYRSSPSRSHQYPESSSSDNDTLDRLFDYENGLDPDLCPRLTGQDASDVPDRTLTPALRKLNRRRVSSRVRTQQWVNQIEEEQRRSELLRKETEAAGNREVVPVALLYDQGS